MSGVAADGTDGRDPARRSVGVDEDLRPDASLLPSEPSENPPPSRRRGGGMLRTIAAAVAIGLVMGGIGAFVIWRYDRAHRPASAVCAPIGCTDLGRTGAPGFTLTDQRGHDVSLAAFRGKAVVLTFMDPLCSDVCPIIAAEYEQANHVLGAAAKDAAFVGVNVNAARGSVADVLGFTAKHGLAGVRNWYFLTGSTTSLQAVWSQWGIAVEPKPDGSVVHTSIVYFVDPAGRIRFTAFPNSSAASMATWSTTIAATVRALQT